MSFWTKVTISAIFSPYRGHIIFGGKLCDVYVVGEVIEW